MGETCKIIYLNILALDLEFQGDTIIQVGWCIGNLNSGEVYKQVSRDVLANTTISPYIEKLTGIKQSDIDNGISLLQIYEELKQDHIYYQCFMNPLTWGQGDSDALRNVLLINKEDWIFGFRHIDAKTLYVSYRWSQGLPHQSGLAKSMTKLGLNFKGQKHRSGDDAYNTFIIYRELLKRINNV